MGFEHFKKNLKYLYPEFDKTVVILSDGLTEWDGIVEDNINYKVYHIDHFCWPIIALFKMKYILDHKIDCDYACYFNGDIELNPDFDWNTINDFIDLSKFNGMRHFHLENENLIMDGFMFDKRGRFYSTIENSVSFIEDGYTYTQSCFFIGTAGIVFKMCEDVSRMIEIDLKQNIIPNYHDESYLNRWIIDNKEVCADLKRFIDKYNINPNFPFIMSRGKIKKLH